MFGIYYLLLLEFSWDLLFILLCTRHLLCDDQTIKRCIVFAFVSGVLLLRLVAIVCEFRLLVSLRWLANGQTQNMFVC